MTTIKQRTKVVVIQAATGERTITVRRLSWRPASEFISATMKVVAEMYSGGSVPGSDLFSRLPALVMKSEELAAMLITRTTDLNSDELNALDWGDVLALIEAAIEINLDTETKNSCSGIASRIKAFAAIQMT